MERKFEVRTVAGRQVVSTGTKWEPVVGYSRAVRAGGWIAVTGTIGLDPGGACPETAREQMERALEIVVGSIEALGGRREHIIRTRIYVTNIDEWKEIGAAHFSALGDILPATTMVEVGRLALPEAKVEVEADALVL